MTVSDYRREMADMRRGGATFAEIGREYGVTRERIRQLVGDVQVPKVCTNCGTEFATNKANARVCGRCPCRTCGKTLTPTQAKAGRLYCCVQHDPAYKNSASGSTYITVERSIQQRRWQSGAPVNDLFYVWTPVERTFMPFDTIEEARAFRDSDARRTPESRRIRAEVTRLLREHGPLSRADLRDGVLDPSIMQYLRHMQTDGLVVERVVDGKALWHLTEEGE